MKHSSSSHRFESQGASCSVSSCACSLLRMWLMWSSKERMTSSSSVYTPVASRDRRSLSSRPISPCCGTSASPAWPTSVRTSSSACALPSSAAAAPSPPGALLSVLTRANPTERAVWSCITSPAAAWGTLSDSCLGSRNALGWPLEAWRRCAALSCASSCRILPRACLSAVSCSDSFLTARRPRSCDTSAACSASRNAPI
mmetsp:Transcript_62582/g.148287  ORF Transcript_62582/g.148287 Transcript_62582/m.148287 type:complete len:200 (-) Transcript_62582:75-674(-)